jgi:transcriptional regulator with XRE-family HTH domain
MPQRPAERPLDPWRPPFSGRDARDVRDPDALLPSDQREQPRVGNNSLAVEDRLCHSEDQTCGNGNCIAQPMSREKLHHATTLGDRLRQAREAAGLKKAELALKTGLSKSQIGRIENGKSSSPVRTVKDLARTLGVTVEWLLTGKGEMRPDYGPAAGAIAEDHAPYIVEADTPEQAQTLEMVKTIITSNNGVAIEAIRGSIQLALAALGRRAKRKP